MNLAQIGSLIAAAGVAALGLQTGLRLTEPNGHTPTRAELAASRRSLEETYSLALERATIDLGRTRKAVKLKDFHSHYRWALAHSAVLRFRSLLKTEGKIGLADPDEELLRIVDLCRECAQNPREEELLARFERGRVWAHAQAGD